MDVLSVHWTDAAKQQRVVILWFNAAPWSSDLVQLLTFRDGQERGGDPNI